MPKSWISCLIAPLSAAHEINTLREENAGLRQKLDRAAEGAESLRSVIRDNEANEEALKLEVRRLRSHIEAQDNVLEQTRAELADARLDDAEVQEVIDRLDEMKVRHEKYRQRIESLKIALADARREAKDLRRKDFAGNPEAIDLDEPAPFIPMHPHSPAPATRQPSEPRLDDNSEDWLLKLPDNL